MRKEVVFLASQPWDNAFTVRLPVVLQDADLFALRVV